jgi:hypothetical protein
MPRLRIILALSAIASCAPVFAAGSLCGPAEQTFFSCTIAGSGKVVSVCGARNTSPTKGYLQYRFGHTGKIEFEYPARRSGSTKVFWWDGRAHRDVADSWFWFKNGGYKYLVYFIEDHATPSGKTEFRTGVGVDIDSQEDTGAGGSELKCTKKATGDFMRLSEIVEWKEGA